MTTATTTYEITARLRDTLAGFEYLDEKIEQRSTEIAAAGGELPEDLAHFEATLTSKLAALVGQGEQKLENLALVRRDLNLQCDVEKTHKAHMNTEAVRYLKRQQAIERTIGRLKNLSASLFREFGVRRHDGERIKTRIQLGTMKVKPIAPDKPPLEFCAETWVLRGPLAAQAFDVLTEHAPGITQGFMRHREFAPELATEAVIGELVTLGREPEPGTSIEFPGLGVIASWGERVVDW